MPVPIWHGTRKRPRLRKNPGKAPPSSESVLLLLRRNPMLRLVLRKLWPGECWERVDQARCPHDLPRALSDDCDRPSMARALRAHLPDLLTAENLRDPRLVYDDGFFEHSHRIPVHATQTRSALLAALCPRLAAHNSWLSDVHRRAVHVMCR